MLDRLEGMMAAVEEAGEHLGAGDHATALFMPSFGLLLNRVHAVWCDDYEQTLRAALGWEHDLAPDEKDRCLALRDEIVAAKHTLAWLANNQLRRAIVTYAFAHGASGN